MTEKDKKNDSEQKPEGNLPIKQDQPLILNKDNKPTKLNMQPRSVTCSVKPVKMKDATKQANKIILEEIEKKKE
jgi:hypothetical protein